MIEQKLSVEDIMQKIREEVRRRNSDVINEDNPAVVKVQSLNISNDLYFWKPVTIQEYKDSYSVTEMLAYDDIDFIYNAYQVILRRDPDPEGLKSSLALLRNLTVGKLQILWNLRTSSEGISKNGAQIRRLRRHYYLYKIKRLFLNKIPFFRYLNKWLISIIKLPVILNEIKQFESYTKAKFSEDEVKLKSKFVEYNEAINSIYAKQSSIEALLLELNHIVRVDNKTALDDTLAKIGSINGKISTEIEEFRIKTQEIDKELTSQESRLFDCETNFSDLHRNISEIDNSISDVDNKITGINNKVTDVDNKVTDVDNKVTDVENKVTDVENKVTDVDNKVTDVDNKVTDVDNKVTDVDNKVTDVDNKVTDVDSLLLEDNHIIRVEYKNTFDSVMSSLNDLRTRLNSYKHSIVNQERRLQIFLEEARRRLPEPFDKNQLKIFADDESQLLDSIYLAFEDKFRGTRDDIKIRQKVYLPYITEVIKNTKSEIILDIGCGRGEWLELLSEENIKSKGVDLNPVMVEKSLSMGFNVEEYDVIEYLRMQKDNSHTAITAFQVIEHLPNKVLVSLLDECLRVLKPGGMIIFETPNPDNVFVGSSYFYLDPTHKNPLPSITMQFLAEYRGFVNVEIKKVNKYTDFGITETDNTFVKNHFYNELDYSIIGYKA